MSKKMTFQEAMAAMFSGKRVRKTGWPYGAYIFADESKGEIVDEIGVRMRVDSLDWHDKWEEYVPPQSRNVTKLTDDWFDILSDLGPDEVRVVKHVASHVADRLRLGARQYGALNLAKDTRDWEQELRAEVWDAAVYSAMGDLKGGDE